MQFRAILPTLMSAIRTRITLRLAIVLAVIFGLGLPAAVLIPYHLETIGELAQAKAKADHQRLTNILSVILSEPLWQITPDIAASSIGVVQTDPRVAKIEVFTLPDRKRFIFNDERMKTQQGPFRTLTGTIRHGDQVIGEVQLTMADDLLREGLAAEFRRYISTGLLSLVLAIAFILYVLHGRLVKPVNLLINESDRLAAGQLDDPIRLQRGDELGKLAQSLDVTRKALLRTFKELEEKNRQLLEYSTTLEMKVRERTRELEYANQHLETALSNVSSAQNELARIERMAALGSMVAGVAHELNTPLGNCLLVASTLADETNQFTSIVSKGPMKRSELNHFIEATNESTKLLLRGLQHAARLVGDFKQVAVDQSSTQRRTFSLEVMLSELAALLQSSLRKTPYTLTLEIPDDIELDSFPGPLGQVFTNLFNNAIAHAFEGLDQGNMRCIAQKQGDYVLIAFEDDGKGIAPDIIKRIFEPFFTTKFGQGGSGLGLSITFNIVCNVLGGEIRVSSTLGKGSRFDISIPLVAPGKPQQEPLLHF